jgi:hypothetical protein
MIPNILSRILLTSSLCTGAIMGATVQAAPLACQNVPKPSGPCVECSPSFDKPELLTDNPPLYWDLCRDAKSAEPLLHVLPKSVSVVVKNGKAQQSLRMRNGELFLTANLNYKPWGTQSEVDRSPHVTYLKAKNSNMKFVMIPFTGIETKMKGQWQQWVKEIKLTPVSGVDFFQTMRLEVTFKPEYEAQVKQALSRPLGMLGEIAIQFRGLNGRGEEMEARHVMALHLGSLVVK